MKHINLLSLALLISSVDLIVSFTCPSSESIKPCICELRTQSLICSDIHKNLSISEITENASKNVGTKLKFKFVEIRNTDIQEIGENDFSSISIGDNEVLTIAGNKYLTKIDSKSLRNVNVRTLQFHNNSLQNDAPNQWQIFEAISNITNVDHILLMNNKLSSIPSNAFSSLTKSEEIYLFSNRITHIAKNAFAFSEKSKILLEIWLEFNNLNESSFEVGSFSGINRPTMIHLAENNISHLSESVFEPFFDENVINVMNVDENPFNCDCRMKWLVTKNIKTNKLMERKLYGLICQNKKSIWEFTEQDFKNC